MPRRYALIVQSEHIRGHSKTYLLVWPRFRVLFGLWRVAVIQLKLKKTTQSRQRAPGPGYRAVHIMRMYIVRVAELVQGRGRACLALLERLQVEKFGNIWGHAP